jgi:hypothetical protein
MVRGRMRNVVKKITPQFRTAMGIPMEIECRREEIVVAAKGSLPAKIA